MTKIFSPAAAPKRRLLGIGVPPYPDFLPWWRTPYKKSWSRT